jgi:hypothetical protein
VSNPAWRGFYRSTALQNGSGTLADSPERSLIFEAASSDVCGMFVNIGARRLVPDIDSGYSTLYEPAPTNRGYSFHAPKKHLFESGFDHLYVVGGSWLYPFCSNSDRLTTRNQAVDALPYANKMALGIGTNYPSVSDGRLLSMDMNSERAACEIDLFRSFDIVVVRDPHAYRYLRVDTRVNVVYAKCPSFFAFPDIPMPESVGGSALVWRHYTTIPRSRSAYVNTEEPSCTSWQVWQGAVDAQVPASDAVAVTTAQDVELFKRLFPGRPFYRAIDPKKTAIWLSQFAVLHSARDTIGNVALSMGLDVVVYPTDTRFTPELLNGATNYFDGDAYMDNYKGLPFEARCYTDSNTPACTPWAEVPLSYEVPDVSECNDLVEG